MTRTVFLTALLMLISACGGSKSHPRATPTPVSSWEVGPTIRGKAYSTGFTFDGSTLTLPLAGGSANYITRPTGSLAGKTSIYLRYRVELDPGVTLHPKCCPEMVATGPTLYFQIANDDWASDGGRWWATFATPIPIEPGEHELQVPFDGNWTSVMTMSRTSNLQQFEQALAHAGRIGFTLGGGDGYGHGIYATGPARLIILDFSTQ
jgi:hypothetical protein